MLNAYWEPLAFELPPLPAKERWHRIADTALPAPDDFSDPEAAPPMDGDRYRVEARSAVVLMAQGSHLRGDKPAQKW
jgi:glycogen operon protein